MRKLLCLLSTVLWLLSCNDVDEFGQMLPDSVALDEVKPVSELTYEELETLVADEGLREEMRRNGGLLVQATAQASSGYQTYDYMSVHYSDAQSALPSQSSGASFWTELSGSQEDYEGTGLFYILWGYDQSLRLPGTTIYCEASASLYGGEQMPGFVEHIRNDYYYGNDYVFSDIRSYTYPDAPVIMDFEAYGEDVIVARFSIGIDGYTEADMPERGICYSISNPLPTVNDEVTYVPASYDPNTYAEVIAQVPGGDYYVRAFAVGGSGEVSYSPVQRVSCQGQTASTQIDTLVYVAELGYNELADFTQIDDANYLSELRINGGVLIAVTSRVEGSYNYLETGLSVDVMQNSLPTSGYNMQYGVQEIWKSEDGLKALYWQPASNFNSYNHNDFYYQAAVGVTGYAGYAVWTYSDVAYRSWGDEPVIENVYYYGENPLAVNMTLTTWDYEAQVGVCYSTSNDLPTLEQCDGVAQCPDTSVGYGVSSYYEFTLPAGTYYVRAYARSEGGLTYAPVQQITITENVTR